MREGGGAGRVSVQENEPFGHSPRGVKRGGGGGCSILMEKRKRRLIGGTANIMQRQGLRPAIRKGVLT